MSRRILEHPVLGNLQDNKYISFTFNNKNYEGLESESIAAALLANGIRTLRYHEESGSPRGIYCNIGHCFECRVTVNGTQGVRACLTPLQAGMVIESGGKLPTPVRDWSAENE
ncbi:(2Fe-2S)-binding protein [Virgibacillus ndiopensis]|uniref:(2Fe-2S)-binding protein n=1 Tax=Virgibacillus ndiopensis TaxID=2004408 RepID=UPI000C0889F8|nr:(2Fe-2S)-binding protein [Virgibacillus ndiopensis]